MPVLARVILAVVFPGIVLYGGGRLMLAAAGASADRAVTRAGTPLNLRWKGYTRDEVAALWRGLEPSDLEVERRLLRVDLIFPVVYGGALALSLLALWGMLGRPFNSLWLMLPVLAGVAADWTENLVQLQQLNRVIAAGSVDVIEAGSIAVASVATMVKLASLAAGFGLIALLVLAVLVRGRT